MITGQIKNQIDQIWDTIREVVEYEAPEVLIGRAAALAARISDGIASLSGLIKQNKTD